MSKGKLDIIDKILETCYKYNPDALFVMSLMHQYEERGSLSKKQLEGLLLKAAKVPEIPANWLATLEATINKMHTKEKSPILNNQKPLIEKDILLGEKMQSILHKYPQHKRVLFLFAKYNQNELLTAVEKAEVDKFYRLLLNK